MASYEAFAQVYDLFMDNIPYETWCDNLLGFLQEAGIKEGLVVDLGCGTGVMTRMLELAGYDMIGIDLSQDMLWEARQHQIEEGSNILYLQQDMREFELYGTVRAIICICDSINYILKEEELVKVFSLVNNYLDPQGLFVFDFNTVYKYEQIGEEVICENRKEGSFIWENYYDVDTQINEYDLTLYIGSEHEGLYERYEENHRQRGYTLENMKECLEKAGMVYAASYDADTMKEVTKYSQRIYVLAYEKGK
ncbi:class I SAM-dependent DNA methyltransferase [Eubacterium oxidoreducens]|uniref:Methyltransferase domain-containing protein n=1 Tax=Eubacterium oxidoreducens TaxID=1732 RepID=A0A1G6BKN2_EUBOX|nr:class I SAM-dependent methyltransferase [Eubacterium oxidoreducens]SDB21190.1 Methyltransferase domain-containing protein [Eubacterium oxidoreducens]